MKSTPLLLRLCCAAILAGCAGTPPVSAPPAPAPTLASLMAQADAAVRLGKFEHAVVVLKTATRTWPADKTAWLRIAQISFECQEYGEAVTHAKKVLERDPDDIVAHSLVAVSGLRVASKALADLSAKKKVSGDVRDAAQDLAKILRTSINGEIIPPPRSKHQGLKPPLAVVQVPVVKNSTQSLIDALNQPNVSGAK